MRVQQRNITDITPYEHNPRINDSAVDAVARSIQEFGFRQPIVVDKDGVIIVGHTSFFWKMCLTTDLVSQSRLLATVVKVTSDFIEHLRSGSSSANIAEYSSCQFVLWGRGHGSRIPLGGDAITART